VSFVSGYDVTMQVVPYRHLSQYRAVENAGQDTPTLTDKIAGQKIAAGQDD